MYVLNSLADDLESIETIHSLLNKDGKDGFKDEWGGVIQRIDIFHAIKMLIDEKLITVFLPSGPNGELVPLESSGWDMSGVDEAWFGMTDRGRLKHIKWSQNFT